VPGIRQGHVMELECIFTHLKQTGRYVQTTGVGLATDAADINDEGITGNRFPLGRKLCLVNVIIQEHQSVDVRVPVTFVLLGELVGRDPAGHLAPFSNGLALEMIPTTLVKASVSPSEVVKAFQEVRTIPDGQSNQSGNPGAVLADDLFHLRQVLGHELARAAHGAERTEQMLLAGMSLDEAQLVNGEVFVKDQVRSTLAKVGVNAFNVWALLRITQSMDILRHVRRPCLTAGVVGYNVHSKSPNPVEVAASMIGVFSCL